MNANEFTPHPETSNQSEYSGKLVTKTRSDIHLNPSPRLSTWDQDPVNRSNSHASISHTYLPTYRPSQPMYFNRMSTVATSYTEKPVEMNQTTEPNEQFSCSKLLNKVTSAKIACLLVGLVVCGIPLAVFVTLWVNTLSTSSSTTATTASVTSPTQCYAYSTLSDAYRNYNNGYACCWSPYDISSTLASGWYRIIGNAGTQLMTTAVLTTSACGASYPGYFNGTLPSTVGVVVTGTVCFYTGVSCGYSLGPIAVINCGGYYIFYLQSTISTSYKYCTTS